MANIGNLAVTLALDAAAFNSGLDKAGGKLGAFGSGITKTMAGVSAAVGVLESIGSSAEGAYAWVKGGIDDIANTGREANRLGVSFAYLTAMQKLTGGSGEGLAHALDHLNRKLQEAAEGSASAKIAFAALGLDAKELQAGGLEKALGKIADKFKDLTPTERASEIRDLLGRGGLEFADKLALGSKGMDELVEKAKAIGFNLSQADLKKVFGAQESLKEMEAVFQGIKTSAIVEFAPVVKNLAEWFNKGAEEAGGLREIVHQIALKTINGLQTIVVAYKPLVLETAHLAVFFEFIVSRADKLLAIVDKLRAAKHFLMSGVWDMEAGKSPFEQTIAKGIEDLNHALDVARNETNDMFGDGKPKPPPTAAEMTLAASKAAAGLNLKLDEQVDTYGLATHAVERYKAAQAGATDEMLKSADDKIAAFQWLDELNEAGGRGLGMLQKLDSQFADLDASFKSGALSILDQVDALKLYNGEVAKLREAFRKKEIAEAGKVFEEMAGPLDKLRARMQDLQHLVGDGLITDDQKLAALGKEFQALDAGMKESHAPAALEEGSVAAHAAEVAFERQGQGGNVQERIRALAERQAEQLRELVRYGKETADALKNLKVKGIG